MIIDPHSLFPDFVKAERPATGEIRYMILYPDWMTLKETRVGVTEVHIHCEIPSDVPGRQIRTIGNAHELYSHARNLGDNIPILYVRTASLVLNYYDFHYVRAFDMVMLPKEQYTKECINPVYVIDIKFHCFYYKKEEKSSGMRSPTMGRFQIMEDLEGNVPKNSYHMEIIDPKREHD